MSIEGKTPDLVRRAAARLSQASARSGIASGLTTTAAQKVEPPPLASALSTPPAALGVVAPSLKEPETSRVRPQGRQTVNISPTSLAAQGISLPFAGFGRTVEEFRIIKRQILANASRLPSGAGGDFNRVVMITSAKPGEGKTYTAINLALSLAFERDLKVLLVDADVYRQSMMTYCGFQAETGWIDLLSDRGLNFSDVLLHTNIPNLTVLPAGKTHPEVPELMSSRKMQMMVTEMARRYPDRFIIFDTLPCLVSSEPAILASMVGQTVFVVAAHETSRDQVESSLRLINSCPSVSLVLNKAEPLLTESLGGSYYGGYQYKK